LTQSFSASQQPIDYLAVGHLSRDLTPSGDLLGGTAAYAGLAAHSIGRQVGILTSCADDVDLQPLASLAIIRIPAHETTTFENKISGGRRTQWIHGLAGTIEANELPHAWKQSEIVHLGPIANEIDLNLAHMFPESFLGMTPQGWLREWDSEGRIAPTSWEAIIPALRKADAVVLSEEDLVNSGQAASEMSKHCQTLVLTLGPKGARVYHRGENRLVPVMDREEVDPTGAGDIFAAAFFVHLHATQDPWTAADRANQVASESVGARGLLGATVYEAKRP
jgi:sugar/nucleoside kinase (ribokinase family)